MIPDSYRRNFDTLLRAAENGDLALLEVTEKSTGTTRYALTAVHYEKDGYTMTPIGLMIDGNPYELLEPPP